MPTSRCLSVLAMSTVLAAGCASPGDRHVYNVRDFGAKGDGRTSDTVAIQSALDAAGRTEGTVYVPSGVYPCHDLRIPPRVTVAAEGQWTYDGKNHGATLLLDSDEARCLVDMTGAKGAKLVGLQLTGRRDAKRTIHGILFDYPEKWSDSEDGIVVDGVKVQYFSGHGLFLNRIWVFSVRRSMFFRNGGSGLALNGWDGFVSDCQFSDNGGHGLGVTQFGATVTFTANRVEWNRKAGLHVDGCDAWNVTGNCFDHNWGPGVEIRGLAASTFTGNVFRRCGRGGQVQAAFSGCKGVSFVGNAFRAGQDDFGKGEFSPDTGLVVEGLSDCVFSGNTFHEGYLKTMIEDRGGHGGGFVLKDNVGRPMVPPAPAVGGQP